jgi:hypothetical protein
VRVSRGDLQAFSKPPAPLPPVVEPQLTLAEEVVLLSLDAPHRGARRAAAVAGRSHPDGPCDRDAAVQALQDRGMLSDDGRSATPAAQVAPRTARVLAVMRRAATPEGADAELLVLLAAAQALPITSKDDRLRARTRLVSVGQAGEAPPAVAELVAELRAGDVSELAERLLPADRQLEDAKFDSGTSGTLGI